MKPIIGITTNICTENIGCHTGTERVYMTNDYVKAIERAGAIPMLLPPIQNEDDINSQINVCDGFIIAGGDDVNPILYNEEPKEKLGEFNSTVDEYQIKLLKKIIDLDKPVLGVCRGLQLINIVLGGNLYQDLSYREEESFKHCQIAIRYQPSHKVNFKEGSIFENLFGKSAFVNSFHHQSLNKLGNDVEVLAFSNDNIVEAVQVKNKKFVLGVQWHPEMMMVKDDYMIGIFKELINKSLK